MDFQDVIHHESQSVNDLDIHASHSAYCYSVPISSIKRISINLEVVPGRVIF